MLDPMNAIQTLTPTSVSDGGSESTAIKDDLIWNTGDFTLISSDGWRFRVSSYTLLSQSKALCDGHDSSHGEKEFQFTDPVIESRSVVSRFLQLIVDYTIGEPESTLDLAQRLWSGMKVARPMPESTVSDYVHLGAFMRKWDCASACKILRLCVIKSLLDLQMAPLHAFMIGALLDDPELCFFSIEKEMLNMERFGHKYFQTLDLANFPITLWDRIPPEYMLALNKSKPAAVEDVLGPATTFVRELSMARDIRSSPEAKFNIFTKW